MHKYNVKYNVKNVFSELKHTYEIIIYECHLLTKFKFFIIEFTIHWQVISRYNKYHYETGISTI